MSSSTTAFGFWQEERIRKLVLSPDEALICFLATRRSVPVSQSYRKMLLDGELVVLDAHGRSDFETLRRRLALKRPTSVDDAAKRMPAAIFAFDLLELRGKDVRPLPLLKRKALLKEALRDSGGSGT